MRAIKTITHFFIFGALVVLGMWGCKSPSRVSKSSEPQKLNVIYILADDLGYGDLGCYGQEYILTPNIDRLAAKGVKFNYHYSGSTVCAPSRSALLTGLHTGHTPIRGNKEYFPEGQEPMPDTVLTTAKLFKSKGYVTGAFGKWGLGFIGTTGDATNQGFDEFFGYNCQREAHRYYPDHLWHNQQKVDLPGNDLTTTETYAQDVIHEKALDFIDAKKDSAFYLFLPYVGPHAEILAPEDSILDYYREVFRDNPGEPYVAKEGGDYGPDMIIGRYCSQPEPRAHFAAMVTRIDQYVGEVMAKLEEHGLTENTLVIFTSDNGPHQEGGADPDFFNSSGDLRGYKRDLYEGGVRVPFVAHLPGKVPAGIESNTLSAFWDMNATYADMLGITLDAPTDGISIWPSMTGKPQKNTHDVLYWEFHERGGRQALRKGDFKLVKLQVKNPKKTRLELYNVVEDPFEKNDLSEEMPAKREELHTLLLAQHKTNQTFPFYPEEGKDNSKPYYVD
ncbi:arylsulfatase [Marinoscillum furvescens]|uniref:Arylsulfatase A-like enzyme n=1 Tax=Marinoscillum furvescens DSM 4134 TaxID=1122208 RepID=A0A3D9L615_MARFU|nr:arylsulfatase [Marinoscillum furvescens]REE00166.1 arylsulfatase A-like enzyme [Marinoscillum furvescens DSM 4134]